MIDGNEIRGRLRATLRDFATPLAGLLAGKPVMLPAQRFYHLLDSKIEAAANSPDLMGGLAVGSAARRNLPADAEPTADALKAMRQRQSLKVLVENPAELYGF